MIKPYMISYFSFPDNQKQSIALTYHPMIKGGRTFTVAKDITVELSDGYVITIKEGTITDLSSIPKILWSLMSPIDEAFIADLIHDYLWIDKEGQLGHFNYDIYKARKFADDERYKWRKKMAPKRKIKNWITHRFLRMFGGLWYSRQLKIPV
ncbi:MAG: DUF1353 domain-containing protein [Chryseobacterium sp.]